MTQITTVSIIYKMILPEALYVHDTGRNTPEGDMEEEIAAMQSVIEANPEKFQDINVWNFQGQSPSEQAAIINESIVEDDGLWYNGYKGKYRCASPSFGAVANAWISDPACHWTFVEPVDRYEHLVSIFDHMCEAFSDVGWYTHLDGEANAFFISDLPLEQDDEDYVIVRTFRESGWYVNDSSGKGYNSLEAAILDVFSKMEDEEFCPNVWVEINDGIFLLVVREENWLVENTRNTEYIEEG